MKKWLVAFIVLIIVSVIFAGGKYTYDKIVDLTINQSFQALEDELENLTTEQDTQNYAKEDNINNEQTSEDIKENSSKSESQTPKNQPQPKNKQDLASMVDESDKARAIQIVTNVVSIGDIPRLIKLASSNTPEARRELKSIYNKFTPSQKKELLQLYNKYKKYLN